MARLFVPVKTSAGSVEGTTSLDYLLIERKFGKTTHFAVVDSETGDFDLVENTNRHRGGTKHTPEIVKESGAEVVISAHMGTGAYSGIRKHGIDILRGELHTPLSIILEKYRNKALEPFTEPQQHDHSH